MSIFKLFLSDCITLKILFAKTQARCWNLTLNVKGYLNSVYRILGKWFVIPDYWKPLYPIHIIRVSSGIPFKTVYRYTYTNYAKFLSLPLLKDSREYWQQVSYLYKILTFGMTLYYFYTYLYSSIWTLPEHMPCSAPHDPSCDLSQSLLFILNLTFYTVGTIGSPDSRTNTHRTFDHYKYLKRKSHHKNGEIIKLFR